MIEFKERKMIVGGVQVDLSSFTDDEIKIVESVFYKISNALTVLVKCLDLQESDNRCYAKAKAKGLPTFTLIATDPTAGDVVRYWIHLNRQISDERREEARNKSLLMDSWPVKKVAD